MAPGTTPQQPVTVEHKPDLETNLFEISEYLEKNQVYDIFDYLMRDLLITQPKDPLKHLVACLKVEIPSGPLQVFVSSPPGVGCKDVCQRLAESFGLTFISAGALLRGQGVEVDKLGLADDKAASEVVIQAVKEARSLMQGFVLHGFPRTPMQTSILKENAIVPTHVLVLSATSEKISERQEMINCGQIEGEVVDPKVLEVKLNQYTCHSAATLEAYADKVKTIDAFAPAETVYAESQRALRMLPRSRGPRPPPRVVVLGPRGSGVREQASRLAARLGAVFVDGDRLRSTLSSQQQLETDGGYRTSIDLPNIDALAGQDPLGHVGVRLRQSDCKKQGYVMCNFITSAEMAKAMAADVYLAPTRVVALRASAEVCVARLRHVAVDKVTGKVWTVRPRSERIRQRLVRSEEDAPEAVAAAHQAHAARLPAVLAALGTDGRCVEIEADGESEGVYSNVVEFVERPLPLAPRP